VPAHRRADVERAAQSGADAVVLDLVEFVADKAAARAALPAAIATLSSAATAVYVQLTSASNAVDVPAAACRALAGMVVSRAESAAQIDEIDATLGAIEKSQGLAEGALKLVIALETARGNQDAHAIITASRRVSAITLGRADLVMDLRPEPSGELHLMPYLMQRLVILAGATGVTPLGAWWRAPDRGLLATEENTAKAAQRGRAMGFKGSFCLCAEQVAALNTAYA
jgi:citrate lyase subunit beta/citryl-CoA lyase